MESSSKADRFVALLKKEADGLVDLFLTEDSSVHSAIASAKLTSTQQSLVKEALTIAVSDTIYTILLALDGEASLGGMQQRYSVLDESGEPIYQPGELEAAAWLYFHRPLEHDESDT